MAIGDLLASKLIVVPFHETLDAEPAYTETRVDWLQNQCFERTRCSTELCVGSTTPTAYGGVRRVGVSGGYAFQ